MNIFILTVVNDEKEDSFDLYFSNPEKAVDFIKNNFHKDEPRKLTDKYFEGKSNIYFINSHMVDQEYM